MESLLGDAVGSRSRLHSVRDPRTDVEHTSLPTAPPQAWQEQLRKEERRRHVDGQSLLEISAGDILNPIW
jgi:hypothetical protein